MLYVSRPCCALDVGQDGWGGVPQLNHDDGLEVSQLVPVREVVARETSPRGVGDGADVLFVRSVLPVTV